MKQMPTDATIRKMVDEFAFKGEVVSIERCDQGHINDSYRLHTTEGAYFLQRISPIAFKKPLEVIENIDAVTSFLRKKIIAEGGNPDLECLTLIETKDGKKCTFDANGDCWRAYLLVPGTAFDLPRSLADFREAGRAFGRFQYLLQDFPSSTLHETIPHFHDTPKRYETFLAAVKEDKAHRLASVQKEVEFVKERGVKASLITSALKDGTLPTRVTHNDTKLNNVLFDLKTGKAFCIVDLDTVMPGSSLYDFGDSIRFGANTGKEDEKDLNNVHFSLPHFKSYSEGFLEGADGSLNEKEIRYFLISGEMMTYECGMRFLTDYLQGDVYFHIAYPEHNLVRARDQFALLMDMEKHEKEVDAYLDTLIKK
jgi:Ser/Thr protein kinase RdoA (MazF antagonist)